MTSTSKGLGSSLAGNAEVSSSRTNASVLGDVVFLLLHSKMHRMWPMVLLERNILPAIHHKQFRLYHDDNGRPIGYVSWAWLSAEAETQYATGTYQLKVEDWKSGQNAWIIDFIAPFGHATAVRRHLRKDKVFAPHGYCKAFRKVKGEDAIRVMKLGPSAHKDKTWKSYVRPIVKPTFRKVEE